jgi:hypothetical protein
MKRGPFIVGAAIVAVGLWLRAPMLRDEITASMIDRSTIRVEVLNGSGVSRAGLGLAEALRDHGFDVVDIRNADHPGYPGTLVLDRGTDPRFADEVARHLGVEDVIREPDSTLVLEVTVILGMDQAEHYGVRR